MNNLRTFVKMDYVDNLTVPLDDIRSGDHFKAYEPDGSLVGETFLWLATSDPFNDEGVLTIHARPVEVQKALPIEVIQEKSNKGEFVPASYFGYNHISNGGYTQEVTVQDRVQYLTVGMNSFGITQKFTLMLNENVIKNLEACLKFAREQRECGMYELSDYIEDTIRPEYDPNMYDGECSSQGMGDDSEDGPDPIIHDNAKIC